MEKVIKAVDFGNGKIVHDGHMITVSGNLIDLYNPDPNLILVDDIAHGLAYNCRWNGHTRKFFSVAQHCCMMHDVAPPGEKLKYLFHDAEEAYWGDMIKPLKNKIKQSCPEIVALMEKMRLVIYQKFNIPFVDEGVKKQDTNLLKWEFREMIKKANGDVVFWLPEKAKKEWLDRASVIRLKMLDSY